MRHPHPKVGLETPRRARTPLETRLYLVALAITLLVRVAAVVGTDPRSVFIRWSSATDSKVYDRFGWNVATRGILGVEERPSAFSLPAYPILLAGIYKLTGHCPGAARWAQVLLSALAVLLLGALARRYGGPRAEILAVLLGGLSPFFVYFVREILTETLFVGAFSAMLLAAARVGSQAKIIDGVVYGMATAIAIMTRPVGFVLIPGSLILARPWAPEGRTRRLGGLLLGALIVAGVWGLWIQRNRQVFGETVLFDTHGGFALYVGQLQTRGLPPGEAVKVVGFHHGDILTGSLPGGPRGEFEADRKAGQSAIRMIRDDPAAFVAAAFHNVRELWLGSYFGDVTGGALKVLMTMAAWLFYGPLIVLGLLGVVQCWRNGRRDSFWAFVVMLSTTTLVHAVVLGGKRYRAATVDPQLIVLAAWQASLLLARWWQEPKRSQAIAGRR